MEKKDYKKPVMIVEKFIPQDYCKVCVADDNKYNAGGHYYMDFSGDGRCQGNEYVGEGGSTTYSNGRYPNVQICQHQVNLGGWREVFSEYISDPTGHNYGNNNGWTIWVVFNINYRLGDIETLSLIIQDGQVYKNLS